MSNIAFLGDPALHFWLTRSTARVMGVSLSEAMAQGQLTPADYAELVTRCRKCPHVGACQEWLGRGGGEGLAECINRDTLSGLRARRAG